MTLTFTLWELAIMAFVIASIVLTVYLVRMSKELTEALRDINRLLKKNEDHVDEILTDVADITKDVNSLVDQLSQIFSPFVEGAKKVASFFGILNRSAAVAERRRERIETKKSRRRNSKKRKNKDKNTEKTE